MTVTSVPGHWCHASSSRAADSDVEAQSQLRTVTGSYAPFTLPSAPAPAVPAPTPTRTPQRTATDPIDDFFGVTRATYESRHDSSRRSPISRVSVSDEVPPPPYVTVECAVLPVYSVGSSTEPVTLAMYLFKFGFVFPPFWILGSIILLSPLTAPEDFEPSKSEADKREMVRMMREVEVKWAKRCLGGVFGVVVVVGVGAAIVLAVMYS